MSPRHHNIQVFKHTQLERVKPKASTSSLLTKAGKFAKSK